MGTAAKSLSALMSFGTKNTRANVETNAVVLDYLIFMRDNIFLEFLLMY